MFKKIVIGVLLLPFVLLVGWWSFVGIHHYFAYSHFKARCEQDGGEFIYKTVDGVEGFLLMRLRDPEDLPSRLRRRDIPEDPYGHMNFESQWAEYLFVSPPRRLYRYLETPWRSFRFLQQPSFKKIDMDVPKAPFLRFSGYRQPKGEPIVPMEVKGIEKPTSRYGVTWLGFRTKWDEFFGVWGGEVIVKDLMENEDLAVRRGYTYISPFSSYNEVCPADRTDTITYRFVSKVLIPLAEEQGATR